MSVRVWTAVAVVLAVAGAPLLAQDKFEEKKPEEPAEKLVPQVRTTKLAGVFGGQRLDYRATIGETILKAEDGTLIYIMNKGYLVPGGAGSTQPGYFRITPYFRVPEGPHDWLASTCIVGGGERRSDPDRSLFRYYALR